MEDNVLDKSEKTIRTFKLKGWKNTPSIGDINANINSANEINKIYLDRIKEARDVLKGEIPEDMKKLLGANQSKVAPKLAEQQAEWAYSKLTEPFHIAQNIFKIDAINNNTSEYSKQIERIINFHFNHSINKRHIVAQAAKNFYDDGVVIAKVNWESETVEEVVTTTESFENPDGTIDVKTNQETRSYLTENRPVITICDYDSIIIDPSCRGDINQANFIAHRYKTNKAKLSKDDRYKNIDKIDAKKISQDDKQRLEKTVSDGNNPLDSMDFTDDSRRLFDITEYWGMYDIYDTGLLEPILISFVGDIIVRIELSPMPDGKLPFVASSMLIEESSVYGKPVSLLIKEEQQIAGNLTRNLLDKVTDSMRKPKLFHPNLFSNVAEKNKFIQGRSATTSGQIDPSMGIYQETDKEGFDKDVFQYLQTIKSESQDITGNMPMTQSSGNKFNSANALGAFVDTVANREASELGKFSEFWINIAKKIISMSLDFMETEEIEYITEAPFIPIPNLPRTIAPYSLSVNVITMSERRDKSTFYLEVINRMEGFADQEFIGSILSKLAVLNDSLDLAYKIEEIISRPPPEPTPEQIRMAELEFRDKEADVQLKEAMAQDYFATSQLKSSRIGTEEAKQEYTYSRADDLNQKIIDKETGKDISRKYAESSIELERQIALKDAETQNNIKSDYVKNLLSPKPKSLDTRNN